MTKTWPTLYKKSSSGSIQQWSIKVETETACALMITTHGQVDGKLQTTSDTIWQGKNEGKVNATTYTEQAIAEAEAKWTKKIEREGYVQEIDRASSGETDTEGGIAPMLAKTLDDCIKHITFPCDYQRKFNGVRCIVMIENGKASLWSRKRKPILGVPHIQAAYEKFFHNATGSFILDGELFRPGWSLQKISGFVRSEKTKPGFEELGHYVYDIPSSSHIWPVRREEIKMTLEYVETDFPCIHIVETVQVNSMDEVNSLHDIWVQEGFEGGILRSLKGKYEAGKRSKFLVKVKRFKDDEYPIVAVNDGRGKFEGKAVFTCKTEEGKLFDCCAPGNFEDRAEFFKMGDKLIGKMLTVKYFEMTDDNIPSFPVGMAVRTYED